MSAKSLTLRKRNKLIVAFARGVVIGQSAKTGGAMNAYRFAIEQRKPVATFATDGCEDTSGNQLIAESEDKDVFAFSNIESHSNQFGKWLERLSSST